MSVVVIGQLCIRFEPIMFLKSRSEGKPSILKGSFCCLWDLEFAIGESLAVFSNRVEHNYGSMFYVMIV